MQALVGVWCFYHKLVYCFTLPYLTRLPPNPWILMELSQCSTRISLHTKVGVVLSSQSLGYVRLVLKTIHVQAFIEDAIRYRFRIIVEKQRAKEAESYTQCWASQSTIEHPSQISWLRHVSCCGSLCW